MTITLPSGQPNERFMRYVRPPVRDDDDHPPLFPLHPETRWLRLGIDVATVPTPPDGLLAGYLTRDEIDVQLLLPEDQEVPSTWAALLPAATIVRVGSTAVPESWPMILPFSVGFAAESETRRTRGTAEFFPGYQLADAQAAPADAQPLTSSQRHRAAAYAAVAAKLDMDAIVTNAPTAGRSDVADNDIVVAVAPDDAVALIGLYLRMTANPVVGVQRGALAGGIGS
ncbi:hypothetical protein VT930_07245 [Mycobacterium sherrisii]|uniref:hypothetical protein n=1 Tax=Mycobacterium sherrisii TaxID=243061 RepID=UPI002DDD2CB3|nr:hypothetical protein [Mycobacterium sherrisii]MEC4762905.1 hypothetical protein [Mycobacterium sherrisii]